MSIYFLQVSAAWMAFLALYYFGFRREKFFLANRIYLLLSFCLALVIPFISWPMPHVLPAQTGDEVAYWVDQVVISAQGTNGLNESYTIPWFWIAYWVGCSIALLRLCWGLRQLNQLIGKASFRWEDGVLIGETDDIKSPFSWGRYLFLNRDMYANTEEYQAIVAHEKAHIQQIHSFDVMLLQVVGIFFWWNPLWYAYRKMMTDVHEYLADAKAVEELPRRAYGKLLLLQHISTGQTPHLTHAFYTSQIKSRIMMLTKKKVGPYAAWKYLSLLPVLALVLFACESVKNPENTSMAKGLDDYEYVETIDTIITFDAEDYTETTQIVNSKAYKEAENMPLFGNCPGLSGEELKNCSDRNMLEFIYQNITYPSTAREAGIEGMVVAKMIVSASGNVHSGEIVQSSLEGDKDLDKASSKVNVTAYQNGDAVSPEESEKMSIGIKAIEKEVLNIVRTMPDWQPGTINDEAVAVQVMIPVRFKLQ